MVYPVGVTTSWPFLMQITVHSSTIDNIRKHGLETCIQINTKTVPYPRYGSRKIMVSTAGAFTFLYATTQCLLFTAGLITTYTNWRLDWLDTRTPSKQ